MSDQSNDLKHYLASVMKERQLSQRALALYAGVASSTISRIMRGLSADPGTLNKLAEYLKVSAEDLYHMAGLISAEEDAHRMRVKSVIGDLYEKLPPEDQTEIIEIIRMKLARRKDGASN